MNRQDEGDLIAELLCITGELGGKMRRLDCYESTGRRYKKIVIEYDSTEEKEMRFKALVFVRLRGSVSDAAGNAVMNNVNRIAPKLQPHLLRIGKAIDFWFDAETEEIAREQMDLLSDRMLANTVIEDWEYTLEETEETGIGNISNDNAGTSKHHLFGA